MTTAAIDQTQLPRFSFGNSPEMADELLALVLAGRKTATCGSLLDYVNEGALPEAGNRSVVLDGRDKPACIIEVTDVTQKKFNEVETEFAFDEGEDDRTLESWRRRHEEFFRRGTGFSQDMILVCERFRVIERVQT